MWSNWEASRAKYILYITLWLEVVKTQKSLRFVHQGLEKAARFRNCVNSAPCFFSELLAAPTRDLNREGWRTGEIFSFCAEQILLVWFADVQQATNSNKPWHSSSTQHGRGKTQGDEPPAGCLALATKVTFYWNWCSAVLCCKFQLTQCKPPFFWRWPSVSHLQRINSSLNWCETRGSRRTTATYHLPVGDWLVNFTILRRLISRGTQYRYYPNECRLGMDNIANISETAFSPELCFEFPIYTVALKGTPTKRGLEECFFTDSLGILGSCQEIMPMTFRILIWKVMSYAQEMILGHHGKSTFPSPKLVTLSFDPSQINMRQTFGNIVFCRPRSD